MFSHRLSPVSRIVAGALAVAGTVGCAPVWAGSPRVPNPVLLGPVDRVGGHHAVPSPALGALDVEIEGLLSASTRTYRVGDQLVRETKATISIDGESKMTPVVLESTRGDKSVDVHLDPVGVGGFAFIGGGAFVSRRWIRVVGNVVRAGGQP